MTFPRYSENVSVAGQGKPSAGATVAMPIGLGLPFTRTETVRENHIGWSWTN